MTEINNVALDGDFVRRLSGRGVQLLILCFALLSVPERARADVILLGTLSFETDIIGASNQFVVGNFTAAESAPPDFPVLTPVTFLNVSLVVTQLVSGSTDTLIIGALGPGQHVTLIYPQATLLAQAQFTATILPSVFALAGGDTFVASSTSIAADLLALAGALVPGDFVSIDIEGTRVAGIPEPAALILLMSGAGAFVLTRLHRFRRFRA